MNEKGASPKYKGIKISVDDDFWEKFQRIKQELGLTSDSEVVRFVITQYYKQHFEQPERKNPEKWIKTEEGWID